MSPDETSSKLVYFLFNKNSVLVVTFAGNMDTASADVLLRCKDRCAGLATPEASVYRASVKKKVEPTPG